MPFQNVLPSCTGELKNRHSSLTFIMTSSLSYVTETSKETETNGFINLFVNLAKAVRGGRAGDARHCKHGGEVLV